MKRSVILVLKKADFPSECSVKIVVGDTDYGNIKVGDGIGVDLDERSHEIQGIIAQERKFLKAFARFKIVDVEATTDNLVYEFEVKNKLSGWKAECRLTSKSAMITEEEHVDRIMDLVMKVRTYGEVDYELVKQPEQTEYFLKHNRGMSAVYCVQLNEVAKCYMEQHELKKAFDAATKAESYAKLIMEDESSVIF